MVESNVSHSESAAHRNYLIPKEIFVAILAIGQYKANAPLWRTILASFYAGFFVVFGGLLALTVSGGLQPTFAKDFPMVPKVLTGFTFWIALILILTYGGELFTGNLMYLVLARMNNRVTTRQVLTNWFISYIGNFLACVGGAYFLGYLTEFYKEEPYHSYVLKVAETKVLKYNWGVLVLRGIGANWLVCMAVCLAVASQDQLSRTVSAFLPVFVFATVGFEHCIANMFFVPLGLMYGAKTTFGEFVANNLIPVTIGNFIGGPIMCGLGLHFLYQVQTQPAVNPATVAQTEEINKKKLFVPYDTRHTITFIKRYIRRTGEVIRMSVQAIVVFSADGKPESIISRLRHTDRAQKTASDPDGDGFVCLKWNGETPVEDCNLALSDDGFCHLLGYSREELSKMTLRQISYSDDLNLSSLMLKYALLAKGLDLEDRSANVLPGYGMDSTAQTHFPTSSWGFR